LLIEIKSRKHDRLSGRSQALTDKVIEEIAGFSTGIREKIRVLSFDPDVLEQVNRAAPWLKCVLNTDGSGAWCVPVADLMRGRAVLDFLSAVCLDKKDLSSQVVAWAHERGQAVFTYCCNNRPQVDRALSLGVDGIMSDRPGWLVGLFKCIDRTADIDY
jgi:glycerophosphoryl diester phosphodiesterase